MTLRQEISDALKTAVKAKDKPTTSTLRLVQAALKDRDIAARGGGTTNGVPDEQVLDLLAKMVRQRQEAAEQYRKGNRPELAEKEEAEIEVIRRFMPRQLDEAETADLIDQVIAEQDAKGLKDMGRVMAVLKENYPGQIDAGKASALVKQRLS
jgi:uncharacterized protein YqeY